MGQWVNGSDRQTDRQTNQWMDALSYAVDGGGEDK